MQKKTWFKAVVSLAVVRAMLMTAYAQELPAAAVSKASGSTHSVSRTSGVHRGFSRGGFMGKMESAVGFTPEQRDAVRGLMAQQRQDVQAVREQTDTKIRTLLNPDQQKKFDAFLAEQKQERARSRQGS